MSSMQLPVQSYVFSQPVLVSNHHTTLLPWSGPPRCCLPPLRTQHLAFALSGSWLARSNHLGLSIHGFCHPCGSPTGATRTLLSPRSPMGGRQRIRSIHFVSLLQRVIALVDLLSTRKQVPARSLKHCSPLGGCLGASCTFSFSFIILRHWIACLHHVICHCGWSFCHVKATSAFR